MQRTVNSLWVLYPPEEMSEEEQQLQQQMIDRKADKARVDKVKLELLLKASSPGCLMHESKYSTLTSQPLLSKVKVALTIARA